MRAPNLKTSDWKEIYIAMKARHVGNLAVYKQLSTGKPRGAWRARRQAKTALKRSSAVLRKLKNIKSWRTWIIYRNGDHQPSS